MQDLGQGNREPAQDGSALSPGTGLDGRYTIERRIASGGFGITYAARHRTLDRVVAIKEHFPRQLAARDPTTERVQPTNPSVYQWALDRFLQEGRSLARCKHPNIVDVADVFEANGTAYMVLAYEEGTSLAQWLARLGRPPSQSELDAIVVPLLDALETVHGKGMLHRDIAPDNIIVRRNGSPCLIDFGAARAAIANQSHAISAIVKSGYSPPEQYTTTGRAQGPWSDIYAFGATLWRCVTGDRPVEATDRMIGDRLGSIHDAATDRNAWRRSFLDGIDAALRLKQQDRPQSVAAWRSMLSPVAAATSRTQEVKGQDASRGASVPRSAAPTASLDATSTDGPVTFGALASPPLDLTRASGGSRVPRVLIVGISLAVLSAGIWYVGNGGRPWPAGSAVESQPVTGPTRQPPAPSAARPQTPPLLPQPAAPPAQSTGEPATVPAAQRGERDCSGIRTITACNAERHCTWSVIRDICGRTRAADGERAGTAPAGCGSYDIVRCNAVPGCEWRINSSGCVASPAATGRPAGQTASPCAQLRTRTACNAAERCFWSDSRSICIGPDSPSGSPQPAAQTAGRCSQLGTRTACNAAERCFWSDSRNTCIGPDR